MLRVLTLSTLFPDATRPNFGIFVERQTKGLAARPDVELRVVAPVGLPPFPLSLGHRHRILASLPFAEQWRGLTVTRPRFAAIPATAGRFHTAMLVRALLPHLERLRGSFAFDIIDAEFFFPDGPAAIALGRHFGVPVSIKARGADIHYWGTRPATAPQVRNAARAAGGVLAVSEALRADIAALGVDAAGIRVHRTGVDLDRFAPGNRTALKEAIGVSGPLVASIGALIPRKGHAIVIDAVAKLPGVQLHIAGEGPERGKLAAQIAWLGIGDRVRLLGSVAHEALPTLLAAADVMALASASEGLANAWVEALACGTPIVITAAGGAAELVDRPAAGRIVARDAGAFADAIGALLSAPPAAADVREAAMPFTWQANSDALFAHLSSIVANAQSSG
ncbi:glycosyltransferase [Sphingomonas japonica]|uniref:Glycosyltransferase involved in cell wall biosynthesis n=1 Tax=Sphingomonas japonica TaxID=511662 RepID=A0ABX0TWM5_9SPHN|nr:glycosyltransferase [Sphingomonas japonica]NIJ22725.1 glycosyltransferase involved in cell wall biosynthesis [Sphingomonas japonica]